MSPMRCADSIGASTRDGALMTTDQDTEPSEGSNKEKGGGRGRFMMVIVVILVIALAIAALLAIDAWRTSDHELVPVTTAPQTGATTSVAPPATDVPATTAAPAAPVTTAPAGTDPATPTTNPQTDLSSAVFPLPDSGVRFTDPVELVRAFAVEFVGFTDPV